MIKNILLWNFSLLFVLSVYTNQVAAQDQSLTRKEKKGVRLKQLVKLSSECGDQTWSNITREIIMILGPSENGEILNKEFECSSKAMNDYYLKTNNQLQSRNVKIYFFEPERIQGAGNTSFVTFSNVTELIKLIRSELQDDKYSRKEKLELIIVQGRTIPVNWRNKIENGWTIEKPNSDYDSELEDDCNCREQALYKIKPCRNLNEFEFNMLKNIQPNSREYDAFDVYPSGNDQTYLLQTQICCGEAFKFRFYDSDNNFIKEMEFQSDEVSTKDKMKFMIYQEGGISGSIQNNIAKMNFFDVYTLKVSSLINGQWTDCPRRFRISFQLCSLQDE